MKLQRNLIVTGSTGMLARALAKVLSEQEWRVTALPKSECDITRLDDVRRMFHSCQPNVLVNCAAYTNVDQCEEEPEQAGFINGWAVGMLAEASRDSGTRMVQISTDAVFAGAQRTPYQPDDPTGPVSAYGRSKLLGESLLRQTNPQGWVIVRTAWLFGDGHCFPRTITERAMSGTALSVVNDQFGSPTYAHDLAAAISELIDRNVTRIWHVINSDSASWFDVASATLREMRLDADIKPISTADYLKIRPKQAQRPAYSVLDGSGFAKVFGRPMRSWREALHDYCRTLNV